MEEGVPTLPAANPSSKVAFISIGPYAQRFTLPSFPFHANPNHDGHSGSQDDDRNESSQDGAMHGWQQGNMSSPTAKIGTTA